MSKIITLVKVFLKNAGGNLTSKKGSKFSGALGIVLISLLMILSIGVPLGGFVSEVYNTLKPMDQQGLILGFGMAMVSMVIFVFGILYVLTTFYFSKDIESLLPLPLKPQEILLGKFISVLYYEYLTEFVILAPILLIYGFKSSAGVVYYIYSLLVFILLPVLPLVFAAIINMIIMRFTNLGKHKDAFRVVGGIIAMFSGVAINILMQNTARNMTNSNELMIMLSGGNNSLINIVTKIFPTSKYSAFALASRNLGTGTLNLLIFVLITGVALIVFMILGNILYFKGVIGMSEAFAKRKKIEDKEFDKNTVQNSAIKSYLIKELRILFRTPSFLINCVIVNFIWPVFILIPLFTQKELIGNLSSISKNLYNSNTLGMVIGVAFAVLIFISSSNSIASTAISREGQNLYINKYIPMRYKDQVYGKILAGVAISMASIILMILILVVLTKMPMGIALAVLVVSTLGVLITSFIGIIIDLNRPKLNWDDENKAVKQNFNSFISLLACVALAALTAYLTIRFKPSFLMAFGGITLISIIIISLLAYYIDRNADRLFKRIE